MRLSSAAPPSRHTRASVRPMEVARFLSLPPLPTVLPPSWLAGVPKWPLAFPKFWPRWSPPEVKTGIENLPCSLQVGRPGLNPPSSLATREPARRAPFLGSTVSQIPSSSCAHRQERQCAHKCGTNNNHAQGCAKNLQIFGLPCLLAQFLDVLWRCPTPPDPTWI